MTGPLSVVVEREFRAPPDRVWRALTDPVLIGEWLMRTDFAPEPGRAFTFEGDWGNVQGEVIAAEPPVRLAYRWDHPNDNPAFDLRSVVTFTLTPTATGTRLRMEQTGFRDDQPQAYGGAKAGWPGHLANLARVAERD